MTHLGQGFFLLWTSVSSSSKQGSWSLTGLLWGSSEEKDVLAQCLVLSRCSWNSFLPSRRQSRGRQAFGGTCDNIGVLHYSNHGRFSNNRYVYLITSLTQGAWGWITSYASHSPLVPHPQVYPFPFLLCLRSVEEDADLYALPLLAFLPLTWVYWFQLAPALVRIWDHHGQNHFCRSSDETILLAPSQS